MRLIPSHLRALLMVGMLLPALPSAQADEQVRRVQEELRKRNLYFGDVDGRSSEEMQAALRRYQHRKGFPESGEPGPETLAGLGIPAGAVQAVSWPEVPVLKSDAARENRDAPEADPPPIGEFEGPAELTPPVEPPPSAPATIPGIPAPAAPAIAPPGPAVPAVPPVPPDEAARVEAFIHQYLTACERRTMEEEMACYEFPLSYFDQGMVGRAFVQKDVAAYYRRWPHRKYTILSLKVAPVAAATDEYTARFRIRFQVASEKGHAEGETDNFFRVRLNPDGPKFVSLREYRIRH